MPRGGRQEQLWRVEPSLPDASAAPSVPRPEGLAQVSQDPKPSIWALVLPQQFQSPFFTCHLHVPIKKLHECPPNFSLCRSEVSVMEFLKLLLRSSNFCLKLIWAKLFGVSCFLHSELSFYFEGYFFLKSLYFFLYSDFSTPFFDIYLIYVLSTCVLADFQTLINYWLFEPNLFLFYFSLQM